MCSFAIANAQNTTALRAAIDIGSGGPKLRIAEIDLTANRIKQFLLEKQYPIIFYESLKGENPSLSPLVMEQGICALKEAIHTAHSLGAHKIVMIGASAFRHANNGEFFAQKIEAETGIPVHILDPKLEAKLAFQAVLDQTRIPKEHAIAWDIGGGSTQLMGMDATYITYYSQEGSGAFRDYIIQSIQRRDIQTCKSPNPISKEDADKALEHAVALAAQVNPAFIDKLSDPATQVIGVGSVFGRGIANLMHKKNPFTIDDLYEAVERMIGKSDADLGGESFACVELSNALLVLGFMKQWNLQKMHIVNANNTEGALVYQEFWN